MLNELPNIAGLPFDIRAEALALVLADRYGLSTEQLLYNPAFWHQRPGRRDVVGVEEDFSHRLEKEQIWIETSREGLFDSLPEYIFLHPDEPSASSLGKVKALSEQEVNARKFLLPFEQLFFWLRLENERKEWSLCENLQEWWSRRFALRETDKMEDAQRAAFLEMLPYSQEIIGDWPLTAQWLGLFTGHNVRIGEEPPPVYALPEPLRKRMGQAVLGQDFTLGHSFTDGIPAIRIAFEELETAELASLLPGGERRAFLEDDLMQYLLPVEIPFSFEMTCKETDVPFELSADNAANVLGYTTHL